MLSSSLNTGSTDLRDTEVQQPNTTETLSFSISSLAFSANSSQFEAGSTTTASSFLPSTPPFLFCSSISISITSLSVVSLIAIVPDKECRMPILIVSSAANAAVAPSASTPPRAAPAARKRSRLLDMFLASSLAPLSRAAGTLDPSLGAGADFATSVPTNLQRFVGVGARKSSAAPKNCSMAVIGERGARSGLGGAVADAWFGFYDGWR